MSQILQSEAIVFKKRSLLNKDALVTIFTSDIGKVQAIAKGVKSINSRRAPHLQTGNLLEIMLQKRNDIFFVQQTKLITAFAGMKETTKKLEIMYSFLYILDKILPEQQEENQIFFLTRHFLTDLARTESADNSLMTMYLQKSLMMLGYVHEQKNLNELVRLVEETIHEKIPLRII